MIEKPTHHYPSAILTLNQIEGLACVSCGAYFTTPSAPASVPVPTSLGSQMFACAGCAEVPTATLPVALVVALQAIPPAAALAAWQMIGGLDTDTVSSLAELVAATYTAGRLAAQDADRGDDESDVQWCVRHITDETTGERTHFSERTRVGTAEVQMIQTERLSDGQVTDARIFTGRGAAESLGVREAMDLARLLWARATELADTAGEYVLDGDAETLTEDTERRLLQHGIWAGRMLAGLDTDRTVQD